MWPYVYFLQFTKFHSSMNVIAMFQNANNIILYLGWIISLMDNQNYTFISEGESMWECIDALEYANGKHLFWVSFPDVPCKVCLSNILCA